MGHDSPLQLFVHIPKTAGSTVSRVMQRQFAPQEILSYEGTVDVSDFANRAATGLEGIRCVMGHIPFGVDIAGNRRIQYLTMLRDPVDWTFSLFSFIKERYPRWRTNPNYPKEDMFAKVQEMSLDDFIGFCEEMGLDNFQTRYLAGDIDMNQPVPPYTQLVPTAPNIAHMNLFRETTKFGLVEEFDLSMLLFRKTLNWPRHVCYQRANVTRTKKSGTKIPPRVLARIKDLHRHDVELYDRARGVFRASLEQEGLDRRQVLYLFRTANAAYNLAKIGLRHI